MAVVPEPACGGYSRYEPEDGSQADHQIATSKVRGGVGDIPVGRHLRDWPAWQLVELMSLRSSTATHFAPHLWSRSFPDAGATECLGRVATLLLSRA